MQKVQLKDKSALNNFFVCVFIFILLFITSFENYFIERRIRLRYSNSNIFRSLSDKSRQKSTNELIERVPMCFGTPRRDHVSTYLLLNDIHFRDVYNLIRLSSCLLAHSSSENTAHCEGALPVDSRAEFFIMRSDHVELCDL